MRSDTAERLSAPGGTERLTLTSTEVRGDRIRAGNLATEDGRWSNPMFPRSQGACRPPAALRALLR